MKMVTKAFVKAIVMIHGNFNLLLNLKFKVITNPNNILTAFLVKIRTVDRNLRESKGNCKQDFVL